MSWGIGDDEFAFGCREVAVGDVNGDALLAFGGKAIGEAGEIGQLTRFCSPIEFGKLPAVMKRSREALSLMRVIP